MIAKLEFSDLETLENAFKIQREAYEFEASLIGTRNIPPLHEKIEELKNSSEDFFGIFNSKVLTGFVATEIEGDYLRISRLVISPSYFRKGGGTKLVLYVLDNFAKGKKVLVSTGEANTPARQLYSKLGFSVVRVFKIEGVSIAEYVYEK
jgi:ribosomal protein S18 acetylase RimI-like enzyme